MTRLLIILALIALATTVAAVGCSPASADPAPAAQVAPPGNPVSERLLVIETRLETIDSIGRFAVIPLMIAVVMLFLYMMREAEKRITGEIRQVATGVEKAGEALRKVERETRDDIHKVRVDSVDRLSFAQELGVMTRRIDGVVGQAHG